MRECLPTRWCFIVHQNRQGWIWLRNIELVPGNDGDSEATDSAVLENGVTVTPGLDGLSKRRASRPSLKKPPSSSDPGAAIASTVAKAGDKLTESTTCARCN